MLGAVRRVAPCLGVLLIGLAARPMWSEQAVRYAIDGAGSTITWDLPATLHTVHGKAPELSGAVEIETDAAGERTIHGRVVVRAAAMKTGKESRDQTMRRETLEVEKFPEIVFETRSVKADWAKIASGQASEATVSGELSVHGKALALEVPVRVEASASEVVLSGSFELRWKAFGLKDPSFAFVTVREPMKVTFRLRAIPAR
jgi:polyisoprenoid-binding protein YceI